MNQPMTSEPPATNENVVTVARGRFLERGLVRFTATLITTLVRYICSFFSGILVARSFGAAKYGDLSFLLGSFAAMSPLLEVGTASAFFTFLAQKRRGRIYFLLYSGWLAFQFVTPLLVISLVLPRALLQRIWVGQERGTVLLAFIASFFVNQVWTAISQMGEARRKTVFVQMRSVLQSAAHLLLIVIMVSLKILSVRIVLLLLLGEYFVLSALSAPRLLKGNFTRESDERENPAKLFHEFARFCKPLMINAFACFLYLFADRWLLQTYAGSEEQGFFAISQQLVNAPLILTLAMQNVFWKELAEARELQNYRRMERLYVSVSRNLYCVGAWISGLCVVYSREILEWTVGPGYRGAATCLGVMFLYSTYYVFGVVNGTVFFSMGDTRTHVKIGLLLAALSLPGTYFALATREAAIPGLGLGATGLAVKMLLLQLFGANVQSFVIARRHGWPYKYSYQGVLIALFIGCGWIFKWATSQAFIWAGAVGQPIASALVTGVLYASVTIALLWYVPQLAGLTTADLVHFRDDVVRLFKPLKTSSV